jgi:hypothetical protein
MSPEHSMEEYPFSVGGRGGEALRNAKTLLGAEAYRMEENKEEIKEDKEKDLINALRFQVMTLEKGIIDKDDFINAIEELAFGSRRGPNTDADFEREQRMQMDMREEDEIEEGGAAMLGPFEFLKSKGIDEEMILAFLKVHAKDIVGASEDEIMDEFENFRSVNYDYIDEDLKEQFKRFM